MARKAITPIKRKPTKAKERSVLEMTAKQARAFFLKPESYCSVELPAYFQFGTMLEAVSKVLKGKPLSDLCGKPREHEGVNYSLLSNTAVPTLLEQHQLVMTVGCYGLVIPCLKRL